MMNKLKSIEEYDEARKIAYNTTYEILHELKLKYVKVHVENITSHPSEYEWYEYIKIHIHTRLSSHQFTLTYSFLNSKRFKNLLKRAIKEVVRTQIW